MSLPKVSAIIPCRNERRLIERSLDSIVANDYPAELLEILIVDGMSSDGTRAIIEERLRRVPYLKLIDNPHRTIPAAMNIGLRHAAGAVIMKLDAHSVYDRRYISTCIRYLLEWGADHVGGIARATPAEETLVARATAAALGHPFVSGNSYFRIGSKEPRWADTTAFGCYRREVFDAVGGYNEALVRSSDMDLNVRVRQAGFKLLLVPEAVADYYPPSTLKTLIKHTFGNGVWVTYPLAFGRRIFSWRHIVPMAFVLTLMTLAVAGVWSVSAAAILAGIVLVYALSALWCAVTLSVRRQDWRLLAVLPVLCAIFHLVYGFGSLVGLAKMLWAVPVTKDGLPAAVKGG